MRFHNLIANDKISKMSQLQNTTILIVEDEKKIVDEVGTSY